MYNHPEESENPDLDCDESDKDAQNLEVLPDRAGLLPNPTKGQAGDAGRAKNEKRKLKNEDSFRCVDITNTWDELVHGNDDQDRQEKDARQHDRDGRQCQDCWPHPAGRNNWVLIWFSHLLSHNVSGHPRATCGA